MSGDKQYISTYTPALLEAVPRNALRLAGDGEQFTGEDVWNAYEFTWLGAKGKPEVAAARFQVPAASPHLIESKSLKLYLGSFAGSRFESAEEITSRLETDLAATAGLPVGVRLLTVQEVQGEGLTHLIGTSLDALDVEVREYQRNPDLLEVRGGETVQESVHTHLFRSLCPLTGQPDLASVHITYEGDAIGHESLLRYLVSYREQAEFGERLTEQMFVDVMERCSPQSLAVTARYTRRGGIDINATRHTSAASPVTGRLWRQ